MPSWINKVKDALHLNRGNKHMKNKPKASTTHDGNFPSNSVRSSNALGIKEMAYFRRQVANSADFRIFIGPSPSDFEGCSAAAPGKCGLCTGGYQIPETYSSAGLGIGAPYLPSKEWDDTHSYDSFPTNRLDPRVDPASINPYENLYSNFEATPFNNNKLEDAAQHQNKALDRLDPKIDTCKLLPNAVMIFL